MSRGSHLNWAVIVDRLHCALTQVDSELHRVEHGAATATLDQSSVGELTQMDAMQQQAMPHASVQQLKTQKRRIAAAMDRITAGTYGLCCECGDTIAAERLQFDPAVLFCTDCQAERR